MVGQKLFCTFTQKYIKMKKLLSFFTLSLLLISCGVKVPYTSQMRDEFGIDTDAEMKKIQFFTSSTIILNQAIKSESDVTTDDDGALVSSSNNEKETVIIPGYTKCIFDHHGPKGELFVRFESGEGKTLKFIVKTTRSKKYYFAADWKSPKGAKVKYGKGMYTVDVLRGNPRACHLLVVRKRIQRNKSKERVIKGMDVN